jgi:hypothetical protein
VSGLLVRRTDQGSASGSSRRPHMVSDGPGLPIHWSSGAPASLQMREIPMRRAHMPMVCCKFRAHCWTAWNASPTVLCYLSRRC